MWTSLIAALGSRAPRSPGSITTSGDARDACASMPPPTLGFARSGPRVNATTRYRSRPATEPGWGEAAARRSATAACLLQPIELAAHGLVQCFDGGTERLESVLKLDLDPLCLGLRHGEPEHGAGRL